MRLLIPYWSIAEFGLSVEPFGPYYHRERLNAADDSLRSFGRIQEGLEYRLAFNNPAPLGLGAHPNGFLAASDDLFNGQSVSLKTKNPELIETLLTRDVWGDGARADDKSVALGTSGRGIVLAELYTGVWSTGWENWFKVVGDDLAVKKLNHLCFGFLVELPDLADGDSETFVNDSLETSLTLNGAPVWSGWANEGDLHKRDLHWQGLNGNDCDLLKTCFKVLKSTPAWLIEDELDTGTWQYGQMKTLSTVEAAAGMFDVSVCWEGRSW